MTPVASAIASVVSGAAGLAGGAAAGLALGRRYAADRWRLWAVYAGVLVGCSALCAVGITYGLRWFAVGALGLMGGLLTGVKYGARGGLFGVEEEQEPTGEDLQDEV